MIMYVAWVNTKSNSFQTIFGSKMRITLGPFGSEKGSESPFTPAVKLENFQEAAVGYTSSKFFPIIYMINNIFKQ